MQSLPDNLLNVHKSVLLAIILFAFAAIALASNWYIAVPQEAIGTYVGSNTCAQCHTVEHTQWTGSHHDRAMEVASAESVLGNFENAEFMYQGVTTRLFRKEGKFFAHTEGREGAMEDFEIKYTFGVTPLQQYMVEFPDGRVQVLRVSWDTLGKKMVLRHTARRDGGTHSARRSAALDRHGPELEPHLCRVPFDEFAKEL